MKYLLLLPLWFMPIVHEVIDRAWKVSEPYAGKGRPKPWGGSSSARNRNGTWRR